MPSVQLPGEGTSDPSKPQHYTASQRIVGRGPLREMGCALQDPIAFAYWRAGPVDRVAHVNNEYPTILFHAAGSSVDSERCNRFRAAGRSWPGEAMFVPIGAEVNCRWREPVEYLHVYFRPGYLQQMALEAHNCVLSELQDRSHVRAPSLNRLFQRLLRARWDGSADPLLLEELALSFATEVLKVFTSTSTGLWDSGKRAITAARLRRVMDRVDSGLHDKLSLQDLAEAAGLSASHLSRAFRAEVGCSPYRFVLERRVERAKSLMQTDVSLGSLADQTGFCNPGHFSNTFRQLTGLSPRQWRQIAQGGS